MLFKEFLEVCYIGALKKYIYEIYSRENGKNLYLRVCRNECFYVLHTVVM